MYASSCHNTINNIVKNMEIIPAIDLYREQCVRLYQGNYKMVEVYDRDPVSLARKFQDAGATRIHIVDLDAARGSRGVNRKKIIKIRRAVSCTLQLGGGIRSDEDIEEFLDIGIDYIVVGTAFARAPHMLEGWVSHFGGNFIAGIDAYDGKVYIEGWEQKTNTTDTELAIKARSCGAKSIIYTNIRQDGTMSGPDIVATNTIAEAAAIPVILSGGISSYDDIARVLEIRHKNIAGIILGTSLYEGRIDLAEAISKYGAPAAIA